MIEKYIRTLCKSNYYQTLYSQDKNIGIKLFRNNSDYTPIQILFLNYLGYYGSLYFDFSLGDVDEKVFENIIYEDAWSYYKRKKKDKKKIEGKNMDKKNEENSLTKSTWVFKKPVG